jgi:hypothetical protein
MATWCHMFRVANMRVLKLGCVFCSATAEGNFPTSLQVESYRLPVTVRRRGVPPNAIVAVPTVIYSGYASNRKVTGNAMYAVQEITCTGNVPTMRHILRRQIFHSDGISRISSNIFLLNPRLGDGLQAWMIPLTHRIVKFWNQLTVTATIKP